MLVSLGASRVDDVPRALARRLDELDADARSLLISVCLATRPLDARRTGLGPDRSKPSWTSWVTLRQARLVRSLASGGLDAVEPYHDRIRALVVAATDDGEKLATHLRLAEAYAAEPEDAEGAALHFALAGENTRALPFALRAAEEARATLAFDRAGRLLELAMDALPSSEVERRRRLELELARCLADGGRVAEAAPRFLALAEQATGLEALDLRRRAMEQLLMSGALAEGSSVMRSLLADLGMSAPWQPASIPSMLASVLGQLLVAGSDRSAEPTSSPRDWLEVESLVSIGKGMSSYDADLAAWFFLRAAHRALSLGAHGAAVRCVAYAASTFGFVATDFTLRQAERWIRSGERAAAQRDDEHGMAVCGVARGMVACGSGLWQESLDAFDASLRVLAARPGTVWESNTARSASLLVLAQLGELAELRRRASEAAIDARARGDRSLAVESGSYLAFCGLADDDAGAASSTVDRWMAEWSTEGYLLQHWIALRVRTLAHLYAGDGPAALAGMERELPLAHASKITSVQLLRIDAEDLAGRSALATALRVGGDARTRLLERVERHVVALEREGARHALAAASMLRGGVGLATGRWTEAHRALEAARDDFASAGMVLHALSMRWLLARSLGDAAARRTSEEGLAARGVRHPAAWARMHVAAEPRSDGST
jgi:hypothetical protein